MSCEYIPLLISSPLRSWKSCQSVCGDHAQGINQASVLTRRSQKGVVWAVMANETCTITGSPSKNEGTTRGCGLVQLASASVSHITICTSTWGCTAWVHVLKKYWSIFFLQVCHYIVTFSSSLEVSVMNRTKSSQPEDTDTVDVLASIRALVDILISSLRPATVPAERVWWGERAAILTGQPWTVLEIPNSQHTVS